jgi:putative endopeptidase
MKYIITGFAATALMVWMASCSSTTQTTEEITYGIQVEDMDTTASPREDFYQYANGGWLDRTEIPADRGRWGSFDALRKRTTQNVLTLMEGSKATDFEEGSDQRKAFVFFQTGMDTQWANENGIRPIEGLLAQAEEVKDVASLQKFMEDTEPYGLSVFFGFGVSPDARKSDVYATYLGNGALGLPDRDYYVKDDEESKRIKGDYLAHVERMLPFIGYDEADAKSAAQAIVDLETALAEPRMDKVQRRNPLLRYNKRSIDQLEEMLPGIDWAQYFEGIGAGKMDTLIVSDPRYIQSLAETLENFDAETWRHYLKWTILNDYATRLTTEIDQANFDFYGKKLRGLEEQRSRDERMIDVCNSVIGEALGKLYVDKYFPQEAKQVASDMVDNILKAFDQRIRNLEWMSDSTKTKALKKLSTFTVKIGYPDKWKDYGKMVVQSKEEGGTYASNIMNVSKFNYEKQLSRIGQQVDASEWFMAPQVVNAYYNPLQNEIVFPAAILQPPFYDYRADAAVNYGGIGAVIGHEISHGFDDQGSRFDAEGNMNNWWTDEDRQAFESRNRKLIEQFDAYEPLPGINVNGAFTLGENIGDLGGINVAFDGLQMHLKENGDPGLIDGMSPSERFFLSWGTIWRTKYRDEALKTQIKTDPHSPAMYRAIGPLSNFQPFYETYGIQEGDAAFRADTNRVNIW